MKEKFVLIGAGSAMFTRGLVADLIRIGQELELALVDIDPEALAVAARAGAEDDRSQGGPDHPVGQHRPARGAARAPRR